MKFRTFQVFCFMLLSFFMMSALNACGEGTTTSNSSKSKKPLLMEQTNAQAKAPQETISVVASNGYKNVRFGMTAEEARDAFEGSLEYPEHFDNPDFYSPEDRECYYLSPKMEDDDVSFMVLSGLVQRIDIDSSNIITEEGAGIGMDLDKIEALYPNSKRKPNFYTYPVPDLIVNLGNDTQIVFEQNNGVIHRYRIGVIPAIEFVEGCQ